MRSPWLVFAPGRVALFSIFLFMIAIATPVTAVDAKGAARDFKSRWHTQISTVYGHLGSGAETSFCRECRSEGIGASLSIAFDVWESFRLQSRTLWAYHGSNDTVVYGSLGVGYLVDLMKFHPKIEAGIGFLYVHSGSEIVRDPAFEIGVGVDYGALSWLMIGAGIHYYARLESPADLPVYITMGPRITMHFPGPRSRVAPNQ